MPRSRRVAPQDAFATSDLRRIGVWILAAKLAAVALFFDPRAFSAFAVPKATLASMFSVVLAVVIVALALGRGRAIWRATPVDRGVAAILGAYLLASVLALNHTVAVIGTPDRALGLLSVVDGAVLYASAAVLIRTRWDVLIVAAALFLPVVPVTAYAVVQAAGLDPLPWKLGFQNFSTFGNPAVLSQYLGMLAVTAATASALPLGASSAVRFGLLAIAAIALAGTLLAGARVALIGLALTAVLVGPLVTLRAVSAARRRPALLGYLGAVAVAGALLALTPQARSLPDVLRDVAEARSGEVAGGSVAARSGIYDVAIAQISERPVFGVGPDNYAVAFGRYRGPEVRAAIGSEAIQTSPHSWLLRVATDAGVVGLLAYAAAVGIAIWSALRPGAHPIGLAAIAGLVFFLGAGLLTVNDPGTEWLPWLALATCARAGPNGPADAASGARGASAPGSRPRPSGMRTAGLVAIGLVALAALVVQLGALSAGERAGRASGARLAGQTRAAIGLARQATQRAPYRAEYWHELGLAYAAIDEHAPSSSAFERAVSLAGYNTTYLTNLARAYVGLARVGDRRALERAVDMAERAVREDPERSLVHYTRALVMHAAGRYADAVEASETALRLAPPPGAAPYQVAASAYLELGRPADAERWIREILASGPGAAQPALRVLLAEALIDLGRRTEALREVEAVLSIEAQNKRALELLEELRGGR